MKKDYNVGLDIGTTSVGWAVVEDGTQKILRKGTGKNRKALWGVRLFDEAQTAEGRRGFRSTRRRYDRRRQRIKLLQEEFKNEINKVDENFFKKLKESKYQENDKVNKTILLTADEKKQIKEYNDKYKTIYHLRKRLIDDPSKEDIRLVYLAIHHILKYRGNFLYNGNFNVNDLNLSDKLREIFTILSEYADELSISEDILTQINYNELEKIIMDKSKNDIKKNLKDILNGVTENKKFATEFGKLITGGKFVVKDLLMIDSDEKLSISFNGTDYDDKYGDLENLLGDEIEVLNSLKELYDMVFLKKIFNGRNNISISDLMVSRYLQHQNDLRLLKNILKYDRKKYNEIFKSREATKNNKEYVCIYDLYIHNKLSNEEIKKKIEEYIPDLLEEINDTLILNEYNEAKFRISNGDFLSRITDSENGKYPYQLNKLELIKIIENQGKYYPFLLDKVNNEYKLVKLLEFRIPYYVGPLNKMSRFAWLERKDKVKITPYNFDEVIDKETTAEKFIKRMVAHCTYLLKEFALPNNSILYDKFKVMNELKQIKINGKKIENDIQKKIIEELFMKTSGTITEKKFKDYIHSSKDFDMYENDITITGYSADGKFANNMQSYVDFFGEDGIFANTSYTEEDADEIIEWITIFDDKDILEKKVRNKYKELSDSQIKKIINKKYSGWGRLSKKLLNNIYYKDKETGINKSIIDLMLETDENFMQIINNDEYKFQDRINEENEISDNTKLNYKLVEDLATSPATKRGIYQSLKVVDEIIKIMGYKPKNVMIEMARGEDRKTGRKDDKKKYLLKLYENAKELTNEYNSIIKNIEKFDGEKLSIDKFYLYYLQECKCLYCGKSINIDDLVGSNYEIDHILPRTLIKDDSFNNRALVCREHNQNKGASFVLPSDFRKPEMVTFWNRLKTNNLMTGKKFYRLTRSEYKDEDIQGFINRQLVETRQITKHVANIINNLYDTNVVYLKANLSHNYRERYELYKFRDLNDYHHAFDAYLTAVLGEYKEKYMKRNINYEMIKELNFKLKEAKDYNKLNYGFVINSLDNDFSDIVNKITGNLIDSETGEVLFDANDFNKKVEDTYYRNDILISRKTEIRSGRLFKETIFPKGKGNVMLKNNMPVDLYGGYSNVETAYLTLVKYDKKIKLIGIPLEIVNKSKKDDIVKLNFIKEHLKLKDNTNLKVLKDVIPFESLINYKNQNVYIKGYSTSHKNCEISNANQLKVKRNQMEEWKYIFNKVLNNGKIPKKNEEFIIDENNQMKIIRNILEYLFKQKEYYPLFEREITKIENTLVLNNLTFEEMSKVLSEMLKIYHCNSVNGNLSEFGLGNRIGRLSGFNIDSGALCFSSVTDIKESTYEF